MFKLGVITDEISQDFELALDLLVEWGVPFAEIRGLWDKNVSVLTTEEIDRAKSALDSRGLKVCGVASPFYKCELTGAAATDLVVVDGEVVGVLVEHAGSGKAIGEFIGTTKGVGETVSGALGVLDCIFEADNVIP